MKKILFLALSAIALVGCDSKLKSAQNYMPWGSNYTAQNHLESFYVQGEWTEDETANEVIFTGYTQKYVDLLEKLNRELPATLKIAEQSWQKVAQTLPEKIAQASDDDKVFYQKLDSLGGDSVVYNFFKTEYKRIAHEILDTNKIRVVFHVDDNGNVGIAQGERFLRRTVACLEQYSNNEKMPIIPRCLDEEMKMKREKGDKLVDAVRQLNSLAGSFYESYDRFVFAAVGLDDVRDSVHYRAVSIGNQVWMGENLRYNKLTDNELSNMGIWNGSNGRYTYETATSICPEGWHLPSEKEWNEMLSFAKVMKGKVSVTAALTAGDWYNAGIEKLNASAGNGEDVTTTKGRATLIKKKLLLEGENLWGFSAIAENQSSYEFNFCEKYESTACPDPSAAYYWADGGKMFIIKGNSPIPTITTKKNAVAAVRCLLNDAAYRNVAKLKEEVSPILRDYSKKIKAYHEANDSLSSWETIGFSTSATSLASYAEISGPNKGIKVSFKTSVGDCTERDSFALNVKIKKTKKVITDGECEYYGDCRVQTISSFDGPSIDTKSASRECATFIKEANLI